MLDLCRTSGCIFIRMCRELWLVGCGAFFLGGGDKKLFVGKFVT